MALQMDPKVHRILLRGIVIPACPLALNARRKLDERRQRALFRYYVAAGVGGLAVGVHTTQFAIRDPRVGLFEPVLALAAEELIRADATRAEPLVRIAGVCGQTKQALTEASLLRKLGFHAGLLNLAALKRADDEALIAHCRAVARRIVGGLLGHWAVWTKRAVELLEECHRATRSGGSIPAELLRRGVEVTDANAAFFDAANGYAGCIAGLHEVLRRQGLLEGIWCLDRRVTLSPGQGEEIDRVYRAYPHLSDDEFVGKHLDEWLRP